MDDRTVLPNPRILLPVAFLLLAMLACNGTEMSTNFTRMIGSFAQWKSLPAGITAPWIQEPNAATPVPRPGTVAVAGIAGAEAKGKQVVVFLSKRRNPLPLGLEVGRATVTDDLHWKLASKVQLDPGENFLHAMVPQESGENGVFSVLRLWYNDGKVGNDPWKLPLAIVSPTDGATVYTERLELRGTGKPGAKVEVLVASTETAPTRPAGMKAPVGQPPISSMVGSDAQWKLSLNVASGNWAITARYANQQPPESVSIRVERSNRVYFEIHPIQWGRVTRINWYGNTELAYTTYREAYKDLRGLHSGLDYLAPLNTPLFNAIRKPATVISVNGTPHSYRAGPSSVLLHYEGDHMVLYGHTSPARLPKLGQTFQFGEVVAYSGQDAQDGKSGVQHLHMEVIVKGDQWKKLEPEELIQSRVRPGENRTNPVPFLAPGLVQEMADRKPGGFHPNSDGRWMTPEDQPDIKPGGKRLVP